MSVTKGCFGPKSAKCELETLARPSSNLDLKTFWKALKLTIELRTEGRKVVMLENRFSLKDGL